MRAWLNLRHPQSERSAAFTAGLERLGYKVIHGETQDPNPGDILVTWNRIREGNIAALVFESRGLPVLVAENASWGNDFAGGPWLHMARNRHNTAGMFPVGDGSRWDSLGIELAPWRTEGETVVLLQRGIGSPPTAMPKRWAVEMMQGQHRIRAHPGQMNYMPIEKYLKRCGHVITWGSGAALKALMMGIPVTSYMPNWIGEQNNTDAGRLAMFRRLAWAQWRLPEIESGKVFTRMLS